MSLDNSNEEATDIILDGSTPDPQPVTTYPDESQRGWSDYGNGNNSFWLPDWLAPDTTEGNRGTDVGKSIDQITAGLAKNSGFKKLDARKIKFNPALHPSMRPQNTSYTPEYSTGDTRQVWDTADDRSKETWRLGSIVGTDEVLSAYKDEPDKDYRYGFRFLYNPTSITMSASMNKDISPQAIKNSSGSLLITTAGIGTVSLELLLNRIPEVNADQENKELTDEEKILRDKGTAVDLDYLFRVANGTWGIVTGLGAPSVKAKVNSDKPKVKDTVQIEYAEETGDMGVVIPTPMWLTLGPALRYYGWLQSVNYKHTMFSPDMVPMLTRVQLVFQRSFLGTQADIDSLNEAASQAGTISGDVFAPPPDSEAQPVKEGTGNYPPATNWEKTYFGFDLPGPRESKMNVVAAARAVKAVFPDIKDIGSYRPSDPYPDHPAGLALDIMIPQGCVSSGPGKELGDRIARFFMNQVDRFAVKYIIWQQRIWNAETTDPIPLNQWEGMSDRGSCVANHMNHVHLSLLPYPNNQGWNGPGWNIKRGTYWTEEVEAAGGGSVAGMRGELPVLAGTPAKIGHHIVAFAKQNGWPEINFTLATGAGYGGHVANSDHYGPGNVKWAGDFGTGLGSKKACWKLARALTQAYDIPGGPTGLNNAMRNGYRLQLIWQWDGHYDHVHIGIRVEDTNKVYGKTGT